MRKGNWSIVGFVLLLALATLACAVPGFEEPKPNSTPTAVGDTMYFNIPAYTYQLSPGDTIPGTGLRFNDRVGDAYQVNIDGQTTSKRSGDSFYWSGVLAPGVFANFNLRLTTSLPGGMPVVGPVEIIVLNPLPAEVASVPQAENMLSFSNIVADYTVPVGFAIPGTTLIYEGIEQRGQGGQLTDFARLSGTSGYPYLAFGDSLVWTGKLLDNVFIQYNLRVTSLKEDSLRLSGTAELWVLPKT
ncbi:MAG: hypothetical protein IAF02_08435 [Anaerolineae bacterium]|nr:hypothetical protein [Anaerolineae bacterium]